MKKNLYLIAIILSILLLIKIGQSASFVNVTNFWQKQLNQTQMAYEAYAGFQQIDWHYQSGKSGMFYQLFGAYGHSVIEPNINIPLIIWLQGGPGSSSSLGAYLQFGPIRIVNQKPQAFKYSWNLQGHLLCIDSPLNVGFSFNDRDRRGSDQISTTQMTSVHLLNFLYNFYRTWPSLKKSPLYIAGESYGGHYVPNFAKVLINNRSFQTNTGVKLSGIIIGDAWIDPVNQINYYDSFLSTAGIVSNRMRDQLTSYQTQALINIYDGKYSNASYYINYIIENKTVADLYLGGISMNNFRNYDGYDKSFAQFMSSHKLDFGVPSSIQYIPSNPAIYNAFSADLSMSKIQDLVFVVRNVRTLIYNGQQDVVVPTVGILNALNMMSWQGISGWRNVKKQIWTISGQMTGWAKVHENLWFVLVNGAGHFVPYDQPQAAFALLGHFLRNINTWKD